MPVYEVFDKKHYGQITINTDHETIVVMGCTYHKPVLVRTPVAAVRLGISPIEFGLLDWSGCHVFHTDGTTLTAYHAYGEFELTQQQDDVRGFTAATSCLSVD